MSTTDYRIRVFTPAGVEIGQLTSGIGTNSPRASTGFKSLMYTTRVNDVGYCKFVIPADHTVMSSISDKSVIEVSRRNISLGFDWTADFTGFYRAYRYSRRDVAYVELTALSALHAMEWRTTGYAAGVSNRTEYSAAKAETVLKNIAKYNMTSSGTTADGRKRDATNAGTVNSATITIQVDAAGGNTISIGVFGMSALEACQRVARIAGGDFDLIRTSAATFDFRWYLGQRGTDRTTGSSRVLFSPDNGNMGESALTYNLGDEASVALTWGQGELGQRDIVTRTGTTYNVSTNNIETFVDARDVTYGNTTGLNARGDIALDRLLARKTFQFQPLQTPSSAYGVHYFLGDKVSARDFGVTTTHKIIGSSVSVGDNGEQIGLELATL